jgi:siroheme synthase-like protein
VLPVVVNLRGKEILVIGGGPVAERKVRKLLEAGGRVRVLSRDFTPGLRTMEGPALTLIQRSLEPEVTLKEDIRRSLFLVLATNDKDLNDAIQRQAERLGKMVSRADGVADLLFPASFQVGDVLISVSTEGKSPLLAKRIKERIRKSLSAEDLRLLEFQEELRSVLKGRVKGQRERERILREAVEKPEVLRCLRSGDREGAQRAALEGR